MAGPHLEAKSPINYILFTARKTNSKRCRVVGGCSPRGRPVFCFVLFGVCVVFSPAFQYLKSH